MWVAELIQINLKVYKPHFLVAFFIVLPLFEPWFNGLPSEPLNLLTFDSCSSAKPIFYTLRHTPFYSESKQLFCMQHCFPLFCYSTSQVASLNHGRFSEKNHWDADGWWYAFYRWPSQNRILFLFSFCSYSTCITSPCAVTDHNRLHAIDFSENSHPRWVITLSTVPL